MTGAEWALASARGQLAGSWYGWPIPLLGWLRERKAGADLDWAFRCARELLPRSGTAHLDECLGQLDELARWRAAPPPPATFDERVQSLWYRPGRDGARTALCRLCYHLGCINSPDIQGHRRALCFALEMLCRNVDLSGPWAPRPDLVDWCLGDFERFAAELAATHPEVGDEWDRFLGWVATVRPDRDLGEPGA